MSLGRPTIIRLCLPAFAFLAVAALFAGPATATAKRAPAVLSPVAFSIADPPQPVLATDGKMHLAYEVRFANQSDLEVGVASIQARSRGRAIGAAFRGGALES